MGWHLVVLMTSWSFFMSITTNEALNQLQDWLKTPKMY